MLQAPTSKLQRMTRRQTSKKGRLFRWERQLERSESGAIGIFEFLWRLEFSAWQRHGRGSVVKEHADAHGDRRGVCRGREATGGGIDAEDGEVGRILVRADEPATVG